MVSNHTPCLPLNTSNILQPYKSLPPTPTRQLPRNPASSHSKVPKLTTRRPRLLVSLLLAAPSEVFTRSPASTHRKAPNSLPDDHGFLSRYCSPPRPKSNDIFAHIRPLPSDLTWTNSAPHHRNPAFSHSKALKLITRRPRPLV